MISISELKAYIQQKAIVSLDELTAQFKIQAEILQPILELHFVQKGLVSKPVMTSSGCGSSCGGCPSRCKALYCWQKQTNC
jgi:hypothetical protein